ncbi:MAG: response regulator [Deltaproteobacteria bacterium]|nr:response regulator [Deltaproteobacteria bacterium]
MPVVWIIEDEKIQQETAKRIVKKTAVEFNALLHMVLWDGRGALTEEQTSKQPDLVVLDLNLSQGIHGLEALRTVPGFENADVFHPYVIIWSHFDGELELYEMAPAQDQKSHLNEDRVIRTYWKSEKNLETALKGFLSRLMEEGVYHEDISL